IAHAGDRFQRSACRGNDPLPCPEILDRARYLCRQPGSDDRPADDGPGRSRARVRCGPRRFLQQRNDIFPRCGVPLRSPLDCAWPTGRCVSLPRRAGEVSVMYGTGLVVAARRILGLKPLSELAEPGYFYTEARKDQLGSIWRERWAGTGPYVEFRPTDEV